MSLDCVILALRGMSEARKLALSSSDASPCNVSGEKETSAEDVLPIFFEVVIL